MPNGPEYFDSYDEPRLTSDEDIEYVEDSPADRARSAAEPALLFVKERAIPLVKEYRKHIAAGIAAIVVIYLLYWFFFASVRDVNFYVTDTEGSPLGIASVKIYAAGSDEELDHFTGSKTISMRLGSYEADVAASGHRGLSRDVFEVGMESSTQEFVLEQDKDLELEIIGFPAKLYMNERRTVTVKVTNNGSGPAQVELVAEGNLGKDVDIVFGSGQVSGNSTANFDVEIAVKHDAEANDGRRGDMRIKGLHEKASVNYDLVEFDPRDLKLDSTALDFRTVSAGSVEEKRVKITNESDYAIENITFEVINASALKNDPNDIPNWFSFNPPRIELLEPGRTGRIIAISVSVPDDAEEESNIDALVIFRTTFWEKELNIDLDVKETEVELSLQGFDGTYYLSKTGNKYESEVALLTLKNTGDVDIENIKLQVDQTGCPGQGGWVAFSQSVFGRLRPDETQETAMTVSAPSAVNEDETCVCNFRITYDDPKNPLATPLERNNIIIINT